MGKVDLACYCKDVVSLKSWRTKRSVPGWVNFIQSVWRAAIDDWNVKLKRKIETLQPQRAEFCWYPGMQHTSTTSYSFVFGFQRTYTYNNTS